MSTQRASGAGDLSHRNMQAWDALYGGTDELVWGQEPIGFLPEFAPEIRARVTRASRVLDAATGEGRNLGFLLATGAATFACDASPHALHKLSARSRARVRCVRCDLMQLPFREASFAFVLLTDVVETLPEPEPVLRGICRLLEPGGLFLTNIPGDDDGIAGVDMKPLTDGGFLYKKKYYYHFRDRKQAVALLESCGLDVVTHRACEWVEQPHPGFRPDIHQHASHVFLARKRGLEE